MYGDFFFGVVASVPAALWCHFAQHVFVLFGYEYFMQLLLMFLVEDKFERTERILLHIQYSLLKVMTDTYLVVQYH